MLLVIFAVFLPQLGAENRRVIPLDMYLIIDGSQALNRQKDIIIPWIKEQILDLTLQEGDRLTIWSAEDRARVIFSGPITTETKAQIIDIIAALEATAVAADFSGALVDAAARSAQTPRERLPYTMLIKASAASVEPLLTGSASRLLRYSRSKRHEGWQVLVTAPHIGDRVRQAAIAYMNSQR